MQIDSIIAQAALSPVAPELSKPTRREKIYCDKWIHEGVCAFTQLGCKYKHEMPLDKATQLSLGLNHGLPVWYKRAQAVQVRPEPQSTDSPSSARTTGPWRRTTTAAPLPAGQSIRGGMQSSSGTCLYYIFLRVSELTSSLQLAILLLDRVHLSRLHLVLLVLPYQFSKPRRQTTPTPCSPLIRSLTMRRIQPSSGVAEAVERACGSCRGRRLTYVI
jgi:hypothetical protein